MSHPAGTWVKWVSKTDNSSVWHFTICHLCWTHKKVIKTVTENSLLVLQWHFSGIKMCVKDKLRHVKYVPYFGYRRMVIDHLPYIKQFSTQIESSENPEVTRIILATFPIYPNCCLPVNAHPSVLYSKLKQKLKIMFICHFWACTHFHNIPLGLCFHSET